MSMAVVANPIRPTAFGLVFVVTILCLSFLSMGCGRPSESPKPSQKEDLSERTVKIKTQQPSVSINEPLIKDPMAGDEECCSDPGAIDQCWWQDAARDGVSCFEDANCPNAGTCNKDKTGPNGEGLCECADNDDCINTVESTAGICIVEQGVCGPSYCNGFLICSCWGGCTEGNYGESVDPEEHCVASSEEKECCEGDYGVLPEQYGIDPDARVGQAVGYCADGCSGGGEAVPCADVSECAEDGDPCTRAECTGGYCTRVEITDAAPDNETLCPWAVIAAKSTDCGASRCDASSVCYWATDNIGLACSNNLQVEATWYGDAARTGAGDLTSCYYGGVCSGSGSCIADESTADGLACDVDDGNDCTDPVCSSGQCVQDGSGNVGNNCNSDDDACTLDTCDGDGNCVVGPAHDCDDSNVCTYPDECVDADADHITPTCSNPVKTGNATLYGYADTNVCSDLMCVAGAGVPTATDCSPVAAGYDLQCNAVACDGGGSEDNCTVEFASKLGDSCDDGDDCTTGDRCVAHGSNTYGICSNTGTVDCDDGNPCTTDSCSAGVCSNVNNTDACDDGSACTSGDVCSGGTCAGTPSVSCTTDQCNTMSCNAATGDCEHDVDHTGDPCNGDSNGCTGEVCGKTLPGDLELTCLADSVVDCSDGNQCTQDTCTSTGNTTYTCTNPNESDGTSCNDSDGCTQTDTCVAGFCVGGDPVTDGDCETELVAGVPGFDTDCNTGECVSTGDSTYDCDAKATGVAAGGCNADNDGCTADYCDSFNTSTGAVCMVGTSRDCSGSGSPPCSLGYCDDLGNDYTNSCQTDTATYDGDACALDADECTTDQCSGGTCVNVGNVSCTPSDACHTTVCNTGTGACDETPIADCCLVDGDCLAEECSPAKQCNETRCDSGGDNTCKCYSVAATTACTDFDTGTYPDTCYDGECDGSGNCQALTDISAIPINNLCSDLYSGGTIFTGGTSFLGSFVAGDTAALTGSGDTSCAIDNYQASGTSCWENAISTDPIGRVGNDVVFAFRYYYDPAGLDPNTVYTVKVEAEFDVGIYIQRDMTNVSSCPEGDDPSGDTTVDIAAVAEDCTEGASSIAIEDECSPITSGCCDECTDGADCGYKWCDRGYRTSDNNSCDPCTPGDCEAYWSYTPAASDCTSAATNVALAIVVPGGVPADTWETILVYVDGVGASGENGTFDISITPTETGLGECEPANYNATVTDVSGAGLGDTTVNGTIEDVVNIRHGVTVTPPPVPPDVTVQMEETVGDGFCSVDGVFEDGWSGYTGTGYSNTDNSLGKAIEWSVASTADTTVDMTWRFANGGGSGRPGSLIINGSTVGTVDLADTGAWDTWVTEDELGVSLVAGNNTIRVEATTSSGLANVDSLTAVGPYISAGDCTAGDADTDADTDADADTDVDAECGGYDCDGDWEDATSDHATTTANSFWPAYDFLKIHITSGGSRTFCITEQSAGANTMDATLVLFDDEGAGTTCAEDYVYNTSAHDNLGAFSQLEFLAEEGTQYLIGISRYGSLERPCDNSRGDNCDYSIDVKGGACAACSLLSSWYSGNEVGTITVNGTDLAGTYTDATYGEVHWTRVDDNTTGEANHHDVGSGWDGKDHAWKIDYTGTGTKRTNFTLCGWGSSVAVDTEMALYDCYGNLLAQNDDGSCGVGSGSELSYVLDETIGTYYLIVDGHSSTDNGAYGLVVYYDPTCLDGLQNGTETDVDCGGDDCNVCGGSCSDTVPDAVLGAFGTPTLISAVSDPSATDSNPTFTEDQLELFFATTRVDVSSDIWVSKRASTSDPWGAPVAVDELNTVGYKDSSPRITWDGLTLYFTSNRPGGTGHNDVWKATRATRNDAFGAPVNVTELNSTVSDSWASLSTTLLLLTLTSERTGSQRADLYWTTRPTLSDPWSTPVLIPNVNTTETEGSGQLVRCGLQLYFSSGGYSSYSDLYVATRASLTDDFGAPEPLSALNSTSIEQGPWISEDGHYIVFFSGRSGDGDIYEASR